MSLKLAEFPKLPYSMLEYRIFNALPKNGRKVDSKFLADARAGMGPWKVENPLNVMTVTMNNLIRKVQVNREPFRIQKDGKRPGHPEVEYWIETK